MFVKKMCYFDGAKLDSFHYNAHIVSDVGFTPAVGLRQNCVGPIGLVRGQRLS